MSKRNTKRPEPAAARGAFSLLGGFGCRRVRHAGKITLPSVDYRVRPTDHSVSQIHGSRESARPDAAVDRGPGETGARQDGGQAEHLRGGRLFAVLHFNLVVLPRLPGAVGFTRYWTAGKASGTNALLEILFSGNQIVRSGKRIYFPRISSRSLRMRRSSRRT